MIRHRGDPPTSFDTETGILIRSEDKKPDSPELIIYKCTTVCHAECAFCYMSAIPEGQHADIEWIKHQLLSLPEMPFKIAIEGGEPTAWPDLLNFIKWCSEHDIVPNASIGPAADEAIVREIVQKDRLGNLGVSVIPGMMGSLAMLKVVKEFAQIPVRAHCIMRKDWMSIWHGMGGILPQYVDGVVFLNFKPHGKSEEQKHLRVSAQEIQSLFETYRNVDLAVAFDSCSSCALKHYAPEGLSQCCDGGLFSMFIDGVAQEFSQCSFLQGTSFGDIMLDEAWRQIHHVSRCAYATKESS